LNTLFITGTDTDAGKTYAAVKLIEAFIADGQRVSVCKPIAAGAEQNSAGAWHNDDALLLSAASNVARTYSQINPFCFRYPASPHISAALDKRQVSIEQLKNSYQQLPTEDVDVCVVEGAGGWAVPINDHQLLSQFPLEMGWPIVLVVGMKLGCLNHALLTASQISQQGGKLVGWIANSPQPEMDYLDENIATLARLLPIPLLAKIGYRQSHPVAFKLPKL
jgi:dethiobiotin synthetase